MYGLYAWLLAKGQVAFLNQYVPNSDHVAIYPEIYPGDNKSNATKVVRYILQRPGVVSAVDENGNATLGPTTFPEEDLKYYFSRMFGDTDDDHYMFLPILDTHLFKDKGKKRTKTAYMIGKGDYPPVEMFQNELKDAILIDRDKAQDQSWLADTLNECELLYQFDPCSAISEVARLCGTSVILSQDWFTKKDYRKYEPGLDGINWGKDEGKRVDSKKFREHYLGMREEFSKKLDKFIEETQA